MSSAALRFVGIMLLCVVLSVALIAWMFPSTNIPALPSDPDRAITTVDIRDGTVTVTMYSSMVICPDTPVMRRIIRDIVGTIAIAYPGNFVSPRMATPTQLMYYSETTGGSVSFELPVDCRLITYKVVTEGPLRGPSLFFIRA